MVVDLTEEAKRIIQFVSDVSGNSTTRQRYRGPRRNNNQFTLNHYIDVLMGEYGSCLYAVKVQRSLAPLSWFPGSRKPTAHVHAKSRRLHAIANSAYRI